MDWNTLTLDQVKEALTQKQSELADIFKSTPIDKMTADQADDVKQRNLELQEGGKRFDILRELHNVAAEVAKNYSPMPVAATNVEKAVERTLETLGQKAIKNADYLRNKGAAKPRFVIDIPDVDVKTLMTNTTGFPPESVRNGLMVPYALRRPMVADLIPQDTIDQVAVVYMEETTFTNNAAPVAEGSAKPESALAYTQRSVPIEVVATFIPVTRQQLDDVVQLSALLDNRLRLMLALKEEDQLLNGSGTTPELTGFYNKSGIQTQAKGSDPVPDAIYKAMTKVRFTGFAEPTAFVMHPNDWQDVRLLRTADGVYIWGSPADPGVERIWGLTGVITTAATENTGLVGDFQLYSHISRKMGVTLDISDSHDDYFVKNKLAIRAEERLSLEIYRATAFCTITSI